MRRTSLITAIVMSCALGATAVAAQGNGRPAPTHEVAGIAAGQAAMPALALDDVVAAAVVGALRMQFLDREVELKLDHVDKTRASLRDVVLDGAGQIRIEGSQVWLPIRFQALYDTATGIVLSPSVTLDRSITNPAATLPTEGLDQAIGARLATEFASQQVDFELGSIHVTGGDERYAVVDGDGVASFAGEGRAELQLQAVYDRASDKWVRIDYTLGNDLEPPAAAFAAR